MSSAPSISVIIPMFNADETIRNTLTSITKQQFDGEILVVNDGSTDGGPSIVKDMRKQDARIKLINLGKNSGHGPARNAGIETAASEYLVFVDADDQLLPGAIENLQLALQSERADLYFLNCLEEKKSGLREITDRDLLSMLANSPIPHTEESCPKVLIWPAATWAKAYRRDFIIDSGIRFPPGFHQDIPWSALTTLRANSIRAVEQPFYRYARRGPGSSTTTIVSPKTLARSEQVALLRRSVNFDALERQVVEYLVANAIVHLLWGLLAAYRTVPEDFHEKHFAQSAAELKLWLIYGVPKKRVRTEPLFPTSERIFLTKALAQGEHKKWTRAVAELQRRRTWKRRLDLSRYRKK